MGIHGNTKGALYFFPEFLGGSDFCLYLCIITHEVKTDSDRLTH